MKGVRRILLGAGWLLLLLAALVNSGCLLAVAGVAASAGAAGYIYYNGVLYRDYHANQSDTLQAVRSSLLELQFPISEEKADTGSAYLKTQTQDGYTVRLFMDIVPSPIPAEGAMTRVGIRVGFSGDEVVSARILDQVSRHLVPPSMLPAPAARAQVGVLRPVPETAPPPLAEPPTALPNRPTPINR
jgi:hypothetical protein